MHVMRGTYREGRILLDAPVDWQEGARVEVSPTDEKLGLSEAEWPTTPEGIAQLLAGIDALEPLGMTLAEESEWHEALEESDRASIEAVRKQMSME